jgi:hypothetical protein
MSSGGGGHSKKADDGSATTPMTSTSIPLAQLQSSQSSDWITGLSGAILMLTYLTVDAFTPNWQKKLLDGEDRKSISTTQVSLLIYKSNFVSLCITFFWKSILV